jgi:hypothetical protein
MPLNPAIGPSCGRVNSKPHFLFPVWEVGSASSKAYLQQDLHECRTQIITQLMTWDDWLNWAKKQRKRTSWGMVLKVASPWESRTEELEHKYHEAMRNHVQFYCQNRRWPKMSVEERCLLYYRMERVEGLIKVMAHSPFPPPGTEQFAQMVEWLIIRYWEWSGWHDWISYLWWARMAGEIKVLKTPPSFPQNPEQGFAT